MNNVNDDNDDNDDDNDDNNDNSDNVNRGIHWNRCTCQMTGDKSSECSIVSSIVEEDGINSSDDSNDSDEDIDIDDDIFNCDSD